VLRDGPNHATQNWFRIVKLSLIFLLPQLVPDSTNMQIGVIGQSFG